MAAVTLFNCSGGVSGGASGVWRPARVTVGTSRIEVFLVVGCGVIAVVCGCVADVRCLLTLCLVFCHRLGLL